MIRPLIAANWKMHKTIGEASGFARQAKAVFASITDRDIVIAPPYTALAAVGEILKGSTVGLAAQNMHWAEKGAFTGEVSAAMLIDAGCDYVILGHSERRNLFCETNSLINEKLTAALTSHLKPIFCIGETLEEREGDKTFHILRQQLHKGLNNISSGDIRRCVIAYEPVWAIGTGKTATPEQAEHAHVFIREVIGDLYGAAIGDTMRILYGGSVTPENVAGLMAQRNINGALVGGASLDIESFTKIVGF
jgi:triosephosphate isomerase